MPTDKIRLPLAPLSAPRMLALLVTIVTFSSMYGQGAAPAGYWTFDTTDINGTQVLDKSGNARNGVLANAISVAGKTNQALSFSPAGSYVSVSDNSAFQLAHDVTLTAWVKSTNTSQLQNLIAKFNDSGAGSGYLLELEPSGVVNLRLGGNNLAGGTVEASDTHAINDGGWHHVAVVIAMGQSVKFYIDGQYSSTTSQIPAVSGDLSTLYLGGPPNEYFGVPFTGALDEVRVYGQALSAFDITSLATGQTSIPIFTPLARFVGADRA
jgi:hypothetical protein